MNRAHRTMRQQDFELAWTFAGQYAGDIKFFQQLDSELHELCRRYFVDGCSLNDIWLDRSRISKGEITRKVHDIGNQLFTCVG